MGKNYSKSYFVAKTGQVIFGILDKIKLLYNPYCDLGFVQKELPRVSKNTLLALVNKGILRKVEGVLGEEGPDYFYWTGKEFD
jgi:hypothetical protein